MTRTLKYLFLLSFFVTVVFNPEFIIAHLFIFSLGALIGAGTVLFKLYNSRLAEIKQIEAAWDKATQLQRTLELREKERKRMLYDAQTQFRGY